MNNQTKYYAEKIKLLRHELSLSQQELANKINELQTYHHRSGIVTRESINRLENGKRTTALPYTRLILAIEKIKKIEIKNQ